MGQNLEHNLGRREHVPPRMSLLDNKVVSTRQQRTSQLL
jgi:hypothetical protein